MPQEGPGVLSAAELVVWRTVGLVRGRVWGPKGGDREGVWRAMRGAGILVGTAGVPGVRHQRKMSGPVFLAAAEQIQLEIEAQ